MLHAPRPQVHGHILIVSLELSPVYVGVDIENLAQALSPKNLLFASGPPILSEPRQRVAALRVISPSRPGCSNHPQRAKNDLLDTL